MPNTVHSVRAAAEAELSVYAEGYVYILANAEIPDGRFKIGFSNVSAEDRRTACETGSPYRLKCVEHWRVPCARELEESLHSRFRRRRGIHREWFRLIDRDFRVIRLALMRHCERRWRAMSDIEWRLNHVPATARDFGYYQPHSGLGWRRVHRVHIQHDGRYESRCGTTWTWASGVQWWDAPPEQKTPQREWCSNCVEFDHEAERWTLVPNTRPEQEDPTHRAIVDDVVARVLSDKKRRAA